MFVEVSENYLCKFCRRHYSKHLYKSSKNFHKCFKSRFRLKKKNMDNTCWRLDKDRSENITFEHFKLSNLEARHNNLRVKSSLGCTEDT